MTPTWQKLSIYFQMCLAVFLKLRSSANAFKNPILGCVKIGEFVVFVTVHGGKQKKLMLRAKRLGEKKSKVSHATCLCSFFREA